MKKKLLAVFAACIVLVAGLYVLYPWIRETGSSGSNEENGVPPNGENDDNGKDEPEATSIQYNPSRLPLSLSQGNMSRG